MHNKEKHDLLFYFLLIGLLITLVVFALTSGILGPQLDMVFKSNPDGTVTVTMTGISEIIVAFAFVIGIIIKLTRRE